MSDTQMLGTPAIDSSMSALELIELEELFSEECECEIAHNITACTKKVTHARIVSCINDRPLMCATATANTLEFINGTTRCVECYRFLSECWSVVPV